MQYSLNIKHTGVFGMNRLDRLSLFEILKKEFVDYDTHEIENGIMCYALETLCKPYSLYKSNKALEISTMLKKHKMPTDLETIIEFFESLLDVDTRTENGIVFTPKFISDYIVDSVINITPWDETKKIVDPCCGGGIFLISAAEKLHVEYGIDINTVIEKYIFGIDIEENNVRRCILALKLLCAQYNGDFNAINCNIHCCDSLKIDWASEFYVEKFTYVIGNPPYVNPHDLKPNTVKFLKENFKTTKIGIFNIFYAFIEHAIENITDNGVLGYIVPNNFLKIKSAFVLRDFIQSKHILNRILDFGNNMFFKPVRTYNCILLLTKEKRDYFEYHVSKKCDEIETAISNISFSSMNTDCLDVNGWKLVDDQTRRNIDKIEHHMIPIKPFVKTGIATLKDTAFMVQHDNNGYFKIVNSQKFYIEDGLVKTIYKIPDLKLYDTICKAERYIIFPYTRVNQRYTLISEEKFQQNYPLTYKALLFCKDELDSRDKGRPNPQGWYAYGRTQGLNNYGKKLLFPTFANCPKFMYIENEEALFCNGYAVFENEYYQLDIIMKILNSAVMAYYVSNTSYSIEGGYYCYQKKYIEQFSIPWLTKEQIAAISSLSGKELDSYLWSLYELE